MRKSEWRKQNTEVEDSAWKLDNSLALQGWEYNVILSRNDHARAYRIMKSANGNYKSHHSNKHGSNF